MRGYVPDCERNRQIPLVNVPIANVSDAAVFPNIAAALEWARSPEASALQAEWLASGDASDA